VIAGEEVRIAFSPANIPAFLVAAREADDQNLAGHAREAHFLFQTPGSVQEAPPTTADALPQYAETQRTRLAATRLSRDSRFSPAVKEQYGHACAICGYQLELVESAHIIEVREEGSSDEVWNGIALCPNHHKLFDAHVLVVRPDLRILANNVTVQYLQDQRHDAGLQELVLNYHHRQMIPPAFFATDVRMRTLMVGALRRRQERTGVT
jgi:putative restriction endonuclease